jgi:hypothetical protein
MRHIRTLSKNTWLKPSGALGQGTGLAQAILSEAHVSEQIRTLD